MFYVYFILPTYTAGTLCSVPLRAVVGVAMLHVPRALQAISLSCSEGQEAARDIPFKNAGNIPLHVRFQVSPDSAPFSASPTALTIPPAKVGVASHVNATGRIPSLSLSLHLFFILYY